MESLDSGYQAEHDTIAAIATAAGRGGIGIVRISGSRSVDIARTLFRRKARTIGQPRGADYTLAPRRINHGFITNPGDGLHLDEVLLAFMPAPHSYTCEDVIEIQCHGGPIVLQKILGLVLANGARPAEAGEFTRRAFINGRIDLTQAEAVADLINARSDSALRLAARQLGGGLKQKIIAIIGQVTDMLADIEAELEFGEDGVSGVSQERLTSTSVRDRLVVPMRKLVESYHLGRTIRDGLRLAIVGRANVGKSSLLNRLIECDKAIVTPFPGTTRDPVEASITIDNVVIDLVDTAGIRDSQDPVERIGIQKSQEALNAAELALFVIEAQSPTTGDDDRIFGEIKGKSFILVANKIDLMGAYQMPVLAKAYAQCDPVLVSARSGQGLEALKARIVKFCRQTAEGENEHVLCDLRHKNALGSALNAACRAAEGLDDNGPLDMVSMDLKHALVQLQSIIGERVEPGVLDAIFKKFCIGK
jgi:tRNA modification GTPase